MRNSARNRFTRYQCITGWRTKATESTGAARVCKWWPWQSKLMMNPWSAMVCVGTSKEWPTTDLATNKRLLLGVNTGLSPPAQLALRVASELLERSPQDTRLVLLHVIPVPSDASPVWGKSMTSVRSFSPAPQQRLQAERVLCKVRTALQQRGIAPERIEWLQRKGSPADEIVKVARELGVDRIVLGSRGNTLGQRIRRVLVGSTSRRVMRLAPCPVTLVVPPRTPRTRGLVAWYKEAVTRSLREHPGSLLVFTACDVAQVFTPPGRTVGIKEVEAAAHALERLASDGILCCQKVKGGLRYFND